MIFFIRSVTLTRDKPCSIKKSKPVYSWRKYRLTYIQKSSVESRSFRTLFRFNKNKGKKSLPTLLALNSTWRGIFYGFHSTSLYRCDFNTRLDGYLTRTSTITDASFTVPYNMSEHVRNGYFMVFASAGVRSDSDVITFWIPDTSSGSCKTISTITEALNSVIVFAMLK